MIAVFWGVGVIGVSGLFLWFPEFFSRFFPGWIFNVAMIIHGDEALLAAGFIFTIHFFNTHLRLEKFPMDAVMFTGRMSFSALRRERPLQHERLRAGNRLAKFEDGPQPAWITSLGILFGFAIILIRLFLLILIALGQFYY